MGHHRNLVREGGCTNTATQNECKPSSSDDNPIIGAVLSNFCKRGFDVLGRLDLDRPNAATNAAEATDEADDDNYFAVLDQAGNAAEAAAAEITGYNTYADLLEALDTRHQQS
jgi:hypothetical protein